jgi:hypothetical protein
MQVNRGRRRLITPRKEVTTMKRLWKVLRPDWQPAQRERMLFNGQLLDQHREDVYVVLYRMGGVIR